MENITTQKQTIAALLETMGLSMEFKFVPFSQSRNAENKHEGKPWLSLNWVTTFNRNGKLVLRENYSQGSAHTPTYKKPFKFLNGKVDQYVTNKAITLECETGKKAMSHYQGEVSKSMTAIAPPDMVDVLHCFVMDSDVFNYRDFEDWAQNCGYETDSREAENVYKACLKTALAFNAAIGIDGLEKLRAAYQNY